VEDKNEYDETGVDSVDFLISTNKGEDARPVNKIASGGELSRIMLAMRSVFRQKNNIDTIIYDEIDTGISGGTCEKIGRKLKHSSLQCQVICITHSAQIAAVADNHYRIYKETIDERTETKITLLSNEERIKELSRIMGGVTISESVLAAAREMIENGTKNGTVTGI
jgi:DNA repair protein RecN (Recombination protein N)